MTLSFPPVSLTLACPTFPLSAYAAGHADGTGEARLDDVKTC